MNSHVVEIEGWLGGEYDGLWFHRKQTEDPSISDNVLVVLSLWRVLVFESNEMGALAREPPHFCEMIRVSTGISDHDNLFFVTVRMLFLSQSYG